MILTMMPERGQGNFHAPCRKNILRFPALTGRILATNILGDCAMLIQFEVSRERADELMTILPLIARGKSDAHLTMSQESTAFCVVKINFDEQYDATPWQAASLMMAAVKLGF